MMIFKQLSSTWWSHGHHGRDREFYNREDFCWL